MAKTVKRAVPVSERALIQRINRELKQDGEQLRRSRSAQTSASVGDYFVVDTERNFIAHQRVDPAKLARDLGVLKPWEEPQC